ncbi:MAG: hypothetical protein Q4G65_08635 [bacterium]|nr:hypothetical protein [bacterium]
MKTSTRLALWGFIALTTGNTYAQTPYPNLMRFDTASAEVREYIVHSITGCVRTASIALVRNHGFPDSPTYIKHLSVVNFRLELGLEARRCVEVLKGSPTVGGDRSCYFYKTSRLCRDPMYRPRVYSDKDITLYDFEPDEFLYYDYGTKKGRGRHERWRLVPPYDIDYGWFCRAETARLAFLTPERCPLVDRVDGDHHIRISLLHTASGGTIKTEDAKRMKPEELLRELGVESVFSNRVFSLNEGCVFHVDYELPRLKQESKNRVPDEVPPEVMRLSSEEVSEVVRLAYAVDGDAAGYDAACARCPQLLKPVTEFRTGIGRMLREALSAGGMLPNGASPAAKE